MSKTTAKNPPMLGGTAGGKIRTPSFGNPTNDDTTAANGAWLIELPQAAQVLGVSTRRVQTLVASNAVPFRRIGRQLRFEPAELRAWIACGCPVEPGSAVRVRKTIGKGGAP